MNYIIQNNSLTVQGIIIVFYTVNRCPMTCKVLPVKFNYQQNKCVYLFVQVNRLGFANHSLSSSHVQRPSRRVEVSAPWSPELSRFNYTTPRYRSNGAYAFPEFSQSYRVGTLLDHSHGSGSFRRYAFSEVPHGTQLHALTSTHSSVRRRTPRQTAGPQPAFVNAALEQSGKYSLLWSPNQTANKQEKHTSQGQNDMVLGAVQPDNGLSWLAQLKRNGQRPRRLNSYPPSVASMEVDKGRQVEVDLPVPQIQMHNVMTL